MTFIDEKSSITKYIFISSVIILIFIVLTVSAPGTLYGLHTFKHITEVLVERNTPSIVELGNIDHTWYPDITFGSVVHLHDGPQPSGVSISDVTVFITTVLTSQLAPRLKVTMDTFDGTADGTFQQLTDLEPITYMLQHSTINVTITTFSARSAQSDADTVPGMYLVVFQDFSSYKSFKLGHNPVPYRNYSIATNGSTSVIFEVNETSFYFFGVYKPKGILYDGMYEASRYYYKPNDYISQSGPSITEGNSTTLRVTPGDTVLTYATSDNDEDLFYTVSITAKPHRTNSKALGCIIPNTVINVILLIGILSAVYICYRRSLAVPRPVDCDVPRPIDCTEHPNTCTQESAEDDKLIN